MSTREVPDSWASLMVARGYAKADGSPNLTQLAKAAHVAVESVRRLVNGKGEPRPETLAAIAPLLGEKQVYALAGRTVPAGAWEPPAESVYLSPAARDALDVLVRELGRSSKGASDGTPTSRRLTAVKKPRTVLPIPEPGQAAARNTGRKSQGQRRREEQDTDSTR